MKKLIYLTAILIICSISFNYAQNTSQVQGKMVNEIASGLELEKYAVEEYKYMVFIQSSKGFSGNTSYSFQLIDRVTNTVYYHPKSGDGVKKYLKKLME